MKPRSATDPFSFGIMDPQGKEIFAPSHSPPLQPACQPPPPEVISDRGNGTGAGATLKRKAPPPLAVGRELERAPGCLVAAARWRRGDTTSILHGLAPLPTVRAFCACFAWLTGRPAARPTPTGSLVSVGVASSRGGGQCLLRRRSIGEEDILGRSVKS